MLKLQGGTNLTECSYWLFAVDGLASTLSQASEVDGDASDPLQQAYRWQDGWLTGLQQLFT